ncbi:hypothetical protein IC582_012631 [Cucumis melo]|uniref:Uncharacterized protein LOC103483642 isoform X1 n=2 Tax=Cucumis melo TaxID=3656 RepID=A0ABM3KW67_CUCME|nr:uncharacterized protein LOC103483642 isoform X1 [Cucumis melo]XP_050942034.1 uncharacterized protein LOC103483642 isoform X1 [Cucumis melo]
MNEDYKSIEPGTDLGLGLGYTDQYIQGRLTNRSGVGANAGSMVDVKYVTTDSLSELVWSPHKGLSLRCADSSFNNRKTSILWDAAANKASFALPQSVIAEKSTSDNLLDNRTIVLSQAESHLKNISEGKQTSNSTSSDDAACMTSEVQMTLDKGVGNFANETLSNADVAVVCFKEEDLPATGEVDITNAGNILVDEVLTIGKNDSSSVSINRINEVSMKRGEPELDKLQHESLDMDSVRGDINEDKYISTGKVVLQPLNMFEPTVSRPTFLGKLESSAENDSQNMNDKNAGFEGNKIIVTVTDSSHEVRGSNQQEKDNCNDGVDSASPSSCHMHWIQRKGKEKALSDGDVHGRMLNNDDNSYGSVESCNSAFRSTSKRRWSFEQHLIVGNKRAKKQDGNASGPTSNLGQDSSFMIWISNMMKGFSESIQDEAPTLDLTLAKCDVEQGGQNEEPMYKKINAPGFSGIGFQSIFRSLYNPTMRGEEGAPSATCQAKQEAKGIEIIKNSCDLNATPIACFGESDRFGKQLLLNNENATELTSGNGPTLLIQLKNSPEISCGSHQSHKTRSQENQNSCNLVSGAGTGEVMPSALGTCKSNGTENVDCDQLCGKINHTTGNVSDPLKSLWISRFAAKASGFTSNPETSNLNTKDDSQCSMHSPRHIPGPQNHIDHHSMDDLDTAVSKEQHNIANTETSPGHKEFKSHNEQKSISKFKSVLRSPKVRSPELMASVFARRLGALKHIIPSDLTINVGNETVTCFYCGTRGHNLHNCSEITEREIEDLSRNIRFCNETVDPPCSCIRCFQPNHWAIACPLAPTRCQQKSDSHVSLADRCDSGKLQLTSGIGLSVKPQHLRDRKMDGVASTLDDTGDPNIKTDLSLDLKITEQLKPAAISFPKCVLPKLPENNLKGSEMVQVHSFVDNQNSNISQAVFNAVKKLRLSRSNILKCMSSHMSLSLLDGFFLRIRLGKWEEGLGGTGYHVACIRGAQLTENSISVIVRGVECQVQTQYISNHDFLEDELRAWWCTASKDGCKALPLAADLRAKVKKKKELGF